MLYAWKVAKKMNFLARKRHGEENSLIVNGQVGLLSTLVTLEQVFQRFCPSVLSVIIRL